MKIYKGVLKYKKTGEYEIITSENKTKQYFIEEARRNGYTVNRDKVKTEKEFDRILLETNCYPWDWNPRKKEEYK